jgi:hypothetical protein
MASGSETASVILKFGAEEHVQQLSERGLLYLKRLDYFRCTEDELPLRFDPWEGADHVMQPGRGHIKLNGRRFDLAGPGLLWLGGPPLPHVFCAFALTDERAAAARECRAAIVDRRNAAWGTHALAILDVPEFLKRAGAAFRQLSLGYWEGLVDYVANDYAGELGPFRKREKFRFQSEFRFAVHGHPEDVLIVEIGSLEDISVLVAAKDAVALEVELEGD